MRRMNRKTTPLVKDGKVQRKNRTDLSPHYLHGTPGDLVVDRQRPGRGYRHVVAVQDVTWLLSILPEWETLSDGLRAVILAPGEENLMGWHDYDVVAICAWERELSGLWATSFVEEHSMILGRLDVGVTPHDEDTTFLDWTEWQVRGFQLLHVLLHELGHHHDQVTTAFQNRPARGEAYAEEYANRHLEALWDAYSRHFVE